ncbi:MAG TPA: DUF2798 domain-containing protein [Tetragenococcus sp.]|nr:DUF2798 domain-containing protein [Tetragenococcus sp.]
MPANKKESLFFTGIMCSSMVLGMSAYNLLLHGGFSVAELIKGFIPGIIIAFILDEFVVGVLAKKIAFKLPINTDKLLQVILAISSCMILGMVTCMSLFGIVMEMGFRQINLANYLYAWRMNFIVALPLQLLIVGPVCRRLLKKVQDSNKVENAID